MRSSFISRIFLLAVYLSFRRKHIKLIPYPKRPKRIISRLFRMSRQNLNKISITLTRIFAVSTDFQIFMEEELYKINSRKSTKVVCVLFGSTNQIKVPSIISTTSIFLYWFKLLYLDISWFLVCLGQYLMVFNFPPRIPDFLFFLNF